MAKFMITGGKPLAGEIQIGGSKNTVLALIAACLLAPGKSRLYGVPNINDVEVMIDIAAGLGAKVDWNRRGHELSIDASALTSTAPDESLSRKLRGSILFAGSLLGRAREATIPAPGGDAIGARPLTTHFHAFEALGARITGGEKIHIDGAKIKATEIILEESSVTATENIILTSVTTPGTTLIRLPAIEPHIQELVLFLTKMGADIHFRDISRIEVTGVSTLHGAEHEVNPDEQEISSFAVLAATTHSDVVLVGVKRDYLDAVRLQLQKMGIMHRFDDEGRLAIHGSDAHVKGFRIQAGLYPKLGSDHLPPFAVLATQAEGESLIHDWLYEDRFRYIYELQKMGANCKILDPHRALVRGPTPLHAAEIRSLDIRSGMTLVIAALSASGQSEIFDIQHLDRGYEHLAGRLQGIGADIQRIEL